MNKEKVINNEVEEEVVSKKETAKSWIKGKAEWAKTHWKGIALGAAGCVLTAVATKKVCDYQEEGNSTYPEIEYTAESEVSTVPETASDNNEVHTGTTE